MADSVFMTTLLRAARAGARTLLCIGTALLGGMVQAEQIRDIADFAGVRPNSLVGYGLVVGLDGSGDQTTQSPFTEQSLTNMLSQLGVTLPADANMQMRNIAAVIVTTNLPAFVHPGQQIDVVVSSIGNAKSLRGGTLLMTPMKGADGEVYALAQGNLMVGGAGASANGSSVQVNQLAGGRISGGAIVERSVPLNLSNDSGLLNLYMHEPDFATAQRVVYAINSEFRSTVASAVDGGRIQIQGPLSPNERVNFMARIESVDVLPIQMRPKVILDSRTGSIVLNSSVKLHRAAVAHGNLSVIIDTTNTVSQPGAFSNGQTAVVPKSNISIEAQGGSLHVLEGTADLMDVVKGLNALGATPQDLMAILQALKAAGSLRAELEII
ncbi:flagellar basal body P-ring protein FlgI [Pseudomonas lijiangensis]|uniref:Flagellar P-ring protein n=1 Tax=Pseudomonas lijiangensis TaxID=2995658 RepID=A0ABX8HRC7_9PSED|nr:flagellar basal body P-ring protein FlgI [Pseudomonas lijiangensis]MBX8505966.1 flagellar basal body P-ring protein FlgI [Pseudomonas lijiangensis]MBX8554099.1 flagellar basal body P-ring protein FlgI [Pseudomonas cichorii]QWU83169.1 flagellar basal body P-ring protein FlgI [Pseudomonas lijiangensis]